MEDYKKIISNNLIKCRKQAKLTQIELAEKLNYSDKAISKWERGESLPDVLVLKEIADFYNVTIDFLFKEHSDKDFKSKKKLTKLQKYLVGFLAICMVWIVATAIFVVTNIVTDIWPRSWLCFIYAIPVSTIVGLVFSAIFKNNWFLYGFISLLCWSILLTIYLTIVKYNIWLIFIIGIPVQIFLLLLMWYTLIRKKQLKHDMNA